MTTKPASPRSRASAPANFSPAPDALREPTIAIIGRISHPRHAANGEQGRGIVDWRAAADNGLHRARAGRRQSCWLQRVRRGFLVAADASGPRRATTPRQIGQALQRRPRVAEMTEEGAKGARADISERISRRRSIRSESVR